MLINSVYIFRDDGTPLLTRYYGDSESVLLIDGLVTPFLAVIRGRLEEISGEGVKEINLGDRYYLIIESFDKIICAFVTEEKDPITTERISMVVRQFYKKFRNIVSSSVWDGNTSQFNPFIAEIDDILGIRRNEVIDELPRQPLDTFALVEYEGTTQALLKCMIRLGESTILDMSKELNEEPSVIQRCFEQAVRDGYLGRKRVSDTQLVYFTM